MPLIYHKKIDDQTSLGVWKNTEGDAYFMDQLHLFPGEKEELGALNPHRKTEWLCSRFLLKTLVGRSEPFELSKDECAKPSIREIPELSISISHSRDHAAVIISNQSVGIDIQSREEKIIRIHRKYISESELSNLDNKHAVEAYHLFWGAKESMYKAWGKKELDFRKHMHIYPFKYFRSDLELKGYVNKKEHLLLFDIFTEKLSDYFLVYAIQK